MATSTDFLLDFRKEEKPEGGLRVKPGVRKARIGKCKPVRSQQKGSIGLAVPLTLLGPRDKKKKMTERLWMSPKCYHRFRELLEACGKKVPSGQADIRRIGQAVSGEEIAVNLVDDEDDSGQYDTKSVVKFQGGFLSLEDVEDDDDDDDEDDGDDELDADDEEEDDTDDDEDDEEDEPPAKRRKKSSARKSSSKRKRSDDDEDDEDDDIDLGDFE